MSRRLRNKVKAKIKDVVAAVAGKHKVTVGQNRRLAYCTCGWQIWDIQIPYDVWVKHQFQDAIDKHLKGK